jgi:hypothetical protein
MNKAISRYINFFYLWDKFRDKFRGLNSELKLRGLYSEDRIVTLNNDELVKNKTNG